MIHPNQTKDRTYLTPEELEWASEQQGHRSEHIHGVSEHMALWEMPEKLGLVLCQGNYTWTINKSVYKEYLRSISLCNNPVNPFIKIGENLIYKKDFPDIYDGYLKVLDDIVNVLIIPDPNARRLGGYQPWGFNPSYHAIQLSSPLSVEECVYDLPIATVGEEHPNRNIVITEEEATKFIIKNNGVYVGNIFRGEFGRPNTAESVNRIFAVRKDKVAIQIKELRLVTVDEVKKIWAKVKPLGPFAMQATELIEKFKKEPNPETMFGMRALVDQKDGKLFAKQIITWDLINPDSKVAKDENTQG